MVIRDLLVKLGFDVDENAVKKADGSIASIKNAALALTGVFTGVGFGLFHLAESTARFGENILETSQRIGLGVEAFQKLSFAAAQAGVKQDAFVTGMTILSTKIAEISKNSKKTDNAFSQLGLTTDQFKNAETAIVSLAGKFSKMEDGVKKVAIARELFGRGGGSFIAWLNEGTEAMKLNMQTIEAMGAIIDEAGIKKADQFGDKMAGLTTVFRAFKARLGLELIPLIEKLQDQLSKWILKNQALINQKIQEWGILVGDAFQFMWGMGEKIVNVFSSVNDTLGGTKNTLKIIYETLKVLTTYSIVSSVLNLAKALMALNVASLLNPWTALAVGITAVVTALGFLYNDFENAKKGEDSFFNLDTYNAIVNAWNNILDVVSAVAKALTTIYRLSLPGIAGHIFGNATDPENQISYIDRFKADYDLIDSFRRGAAQPNVSRGNSAISTINNVNNKIEVTVPPGTMKEQVDFIAEEINKVFDEKWDDMTLSTQQVTSPGFE